MRTSRDKLRYPFPLYYELFFDVVGRVSRPPEDAGSNTQRPNYSFLRTLESRLAAAHEAVAAVSTSRAPDA
jgi:hypothetical protein